jgi:hypothetical protein
VWQHLLPANDALGAYAGKDSVWLHVLLDSARLSAYIDSLQKIQFAHAVCFKSSREIDQLITAATHEPREGFELGDVKNSSFQCLVCRLGFQSEDLVR